MDYNFAMNQLVEELSSFFLSSNYSKVIGKFISSFCSNYEADASTAIFPIVIVILGCSCLYLLTHILKQRPNSKIKPKSFDRTRSYIIREIHSGNNILYRLREDFNKARVNPATLANTNKVLEALLKEEHLDLIMLQQAVSKLEMSGSEDSALKILEAAVKKAYNANKPHEAYEIDMLLVEMFIYKGEFEKAMKRKCLKDESLKDARRPLYKAIIHQMEANTKNSRKHARQAKQSWEQFLSVRDPPYEGDALSFVDQSEDSKSFKMFQQNVKRLQSALQELAGRNN